MIDTYNAILPNGESQSWCTSVWFKFSNPQTLFNILVVFTGKIEDEGQIAVLGLDG